MQDIFGDGWEGRNLTINVANSTHVLSKATETQVGNSTVIKYKVTLLNGTDVYYEPGKQIYTGTLYSGDLNVNYTCIRPGVCYEAHMPGGAWAEEILWEIKEPTYNVTPIDNNAGLVIAKGGAPANCQFSIPDVVTGMTFCPTNCNRFPLDPTAFPSASPTGSSMPSTVSNFPSEMPSMLPSLEPSDLPSSLSTLDPSDLPSTFPSLEPSEEPSESPLAAPSPPPVSVSQRVPVTPTTTNAPASVTPIPVLTTEQPTPLPNVSPPTFRSSNGGSYRRPVPTATSLTVAVTPTRKPRRRNRKPRRRNRKPRTPGPPIPAASEPTPQVSNRNPYPNIRPGSSGGNPSTRVNYRHSWNSGKTASQPTSSPVVKETLDIDTGSKPTADPVVKETLDVSDIGNGIRR